MQALLGKFTQMRAQMLNMGRMMQLSTPEGGLVRRVGGLGRAGVTAGSCWASPVCFTVLAQP